MDVHHPLVVGHDDVHNRVDHAVRQVAVGNRKVPHGNRTRVRFECGICAGRDVKGRNREGFHDGRLLCFGELDDVHVGLHFELADGWHGHTGGKCDHVDQTILQLTTKVAPRAVAAIKFDAKRFHHAWEIRVGCGPSWAETDTRTCRDVSNRCDAGRRQGRHGKRCLVHWEHRACVVHCQTGGNRAQACDRFGGWTHCGHTELRVASVNQRHVLTWATCDFTATCQAKLFGDQVRPAGPICEICAALRRGCDRKAFGPAGTILMPVSECGHSSQCGHGECCYKFHKCFLHYVIVPLRRPTRHAGTIILRGIVR